jgi:flagellar FliL protein
MADSEENQNESPKKASKLPIIIGVLLALLGGGGGFFAVYTGLILSGGSEDAAYQDKAESFDVSSMPDVAFIPLEPMVISLDNGTSGRHLRFRAQLEVKPNHKNEVETLIPRVIDVLNSYLRALDPTDFEGNAALVKLRSQMLRRVQIVTGGDRVDDLLIMEFVLN